MSTLRDFAQFAGRALVSLAVLNSLADMLNLEALSRLERVLIGGTLLALCLPVLFDKARTDQA